MKRTPQGNRAVDRSPDSLSPTEDHKALISRSRRSFLGKISTGAAATMAAGVLGSAPAALAQSSKSSAAGTAALPAASNARVAQAFALRLARATADSLVPVPPHTTNGDENRYSDHSGSYSKPLLQDDICLVNPAAWASFKKALKSGKNSDFEAIILGGTRTSTAPKVPIPLIWRVWTRCSSAMRRPAEIRTVLPSCHPSIRSPARLTEPS